jgi:hypothetical protein
MDPNEPESEKCKKWLYQKLEGRELSRDEFFSLLRAISKHENGPNGPKYGGSPIGWVKNRDAAIVHAVAQEAGVWS